MSIFWRSVGIPLFNCEVSLTLTWSKHCVILSKAKIDAVAATKLSATNVSNRAFGVNVSARNATFKITDTNLYVPFVTLSTEDDNNFLEQLKSGFKRFIKWNKQLNNLNHLIDPTFNKVNRLFVLSFDNEEERALHTKI